MAIAGASVQSMPVVPAQETGNGFKVAIVGAPEQFSDFAVLVFLGANAKTPETTLKTPAKTSKPILKLKYDLKVCI